LIPAMRFMSSSLGVECSFCHVEGHLEKDEKKPKQKARGMMRMMFALNASNFAGRRAVTCYSCHRGARKPAVTPNVDSGLQLNSESVSPEAPTLPTNLPTARQLIDNYVKAVGGSAAIEKVTSRLEKGAAANFGGQSVSVEVFIQNPARQVLVRHLPDGSSVTTFDGYAGWFGIPGGPTHDTQDADLEAARMDADLHFPLHIQQIFPELRVEYPEQIGDREAYVLFCIRDGQPPVKLYFDEQSNLLLRLVRYAESPLGLNHAQIDYADYREVDGVQVPFRLILSQAGHSSTIQIEEMHQNVPIDDAKFAKPASDRSQD
jgi:photosynthetic reaction center cytochrome c subunit